MRLIGLAHLIAAVVFFFFPGELVYLINVGPKVFKVTEVIPEPSERLWLVMASTLMALTALLCFFSSRSPQIRGYVFSVLLAKGVSGSGFVYMFLYDQRYFAYIVGIAIETVLALLITWSLVRTRR